MLGIQNRFKLNPGRSHWRIFDPRAHRLGFCLFQSLDHCLTRQGIDQSSETIAQKAKEYANLPANIAFFEQQAVNYEMAIANSRPLFWPPILEEYGNAIYMYI